MPTHEEIEAAKTPKGGWTKAQLAAWGVSWPPEKGWRQRITTGGLKRRKFIAPPAESSGLDAEREERIMIAKSRASVSIMAADDPRRVAVESFLRRSHWRLEVTA